MTTPSRADVLAVLRQGLSRIERGWTRHTVARTANGCGTYAASPAAVAWCASGACHSLEEGRGMTAPEQWAIRELGVTIDGVALAAYNDADGRTQGDVVDLYRRTLARLEAAEEAAIQGCIE